jgi:hypothetical protein
LMNNSIWQEESGAAALALCGVWLIEVTCDLRTLSKINLTMLSVRFTAGSSRSEFNKLFCLNSITYKTGTHIAYIPSS